MEPAQVATEAMLTPGEVAQLFRVQPKTVARWADDGKIAVARTLGGHRRFRVSDVERLMRRLGTLGEDERLALPIRMPTPAATARP
ncbi:MAG: BldC family transcriptional regulator [Bowdeniella nasicola]|nr:BldC family transcriptional regulator [Bowdeniella nasicola]